MKKIPLSGVHGAGKFALVDDDLFEVLSKVSWWFDAATGYARGRVGGEVRSMHRYIMQPPPGYQVDHLKGRKLDNRRSQLRNATPAQNSANGPMRGNRTGYKGVKYFPNRRRPWMARVTVNRQEVYLGYFSTALAAAKAYNVGATKYHGEYALLNNI